MIKKLGSYLKRYKRKKSKDKRMIQLNNFELVFKKISIDKQMKNEYNNYNK